MRNCFRTKPGPYRAQMYRYTSNIRDICSVFGSVYWRTVCRFDPLVNVTAAGDAIWFLPNTQSSIPVRTPVMQQSFRIGNHICNPLIFRSLKTLQCAAHASLHKRSHTKKTATCKIYSSQCRCVFFVFLFIFCWSCTRTVRCLWLFRPSASGVFDFVRLARSNPTNQRKEKTESRWSDLTSSQAFTMVSSIQIQTHTRHAIRV